MVVSIKHDIKNLLLDRLLISISVLLCNLILIKYSLWNQNIILDSYVIISILI